MTLVEPIKFATNRACCRANNAHHKSFAACVLESVCKLAFRSATPDPSSENNSVYGTRTFLADLVDCTGSVLVRHLIPIISWAGGILENSNQELLGRTSSLSAPLYSGGRN